MILIELNQHATELIFHKPVPANKMEFLAYSTTRNAPCIHPSHDPILELFQTFPNEVKVGTTESKQPVLYS